NKVEDEVRENFEKSEKEIFVREKIKTLSSEIGIVDAKESEVKEFTRLVDEAKVDKRVKDSLYVEIKSFAAVSSNSPEYGSLRAHLEFVTSLPWNKKSKAIQDIKEVDEHLNELHYGLDKAKTIIEEFMTLKKENKNLHSPVLCLIGPPGTGKTTFARELAGSCNREFVKVSVGGLSDSSELIGHRRTYIGAGPGKIMEGIRKCGVNNPIILIDEVDKMAKDYRGDPASVLLEVLDQNQNREFVDNYVQEPFDLSNVLFILTANDESKIPKALYDRLEVIEVSSYTLIDKIEIAKNYTIPRFGKEYGFDHKKVKFTDDAIAKLITSYTREAGVRELERKMASIIRKLLIKGLDKTVTIKDTDIEKYLGLGKFAEFKSSYSSSGVVNVPACTSLGGCLLNIEVSFTGEKEYLFATGSLGKVMQESASVAIGYLKSAPKEIKLDRKRLYESMHIHVLDGATPKEGPSAGMGIAVAIVSEILGTKVPQEYAFTGEITLKGRILKVGGIKEKLISAYNAGIRRVFIPDENESDLYLLPKKVLKNMEIVCVNSFTEVYMDVFK
ncbi:MAG TPA: endopeptidase La, partial [Firmicutes bacterium]|nr:endopeptidase La [Bacillota bacterium]